MGGMDDQYEPPEIIKLARRIAEELGGSLQVEGWIGPTGHQGREFAVGLNGQHAALELGESDIIAFPSDRQARKRVEERIRYQMKSMLAGGHLANDTLPNS